MGKAVPILLLIVFGSSLKAASQQLLRPVTDSAARIISIKVLPQNFYNQKLSFTCKKELQLQKITSLPIFIRLGSKDYVDYLEKKPNALWTTK